MTCVEPEPADPARLGIHGVLRIENLEDFIGSAGRVGVRVSDVLATVAISELRVVSLFLLGEYVNVHEREYANL